MGMGMRMGCYVEHRHQQVLRLTLEQRLQLRQKLQVLLFNREYRPSATCPRCDHKLSAVEILRGFNREPLDFTTRCPKCELRFEAKLAINENSTNSVSGLLCPDQTLYALKQSDSSLDANKIRVSQPSLFHSAIYNFGSLRFAFSKIGIDYSMPGTEKRELREKAIPFLGQAPDAEIARCVGVSAKTVGRWRKALDIERFYVK